MAQNDYCKCNSYACNMLIYNNIIEINSININCLNSIDIFCQKMIML